MDYSAHAQGLITFANLPVYEKARIIHFPPPVDYVPPKEPVAVQWLANVLNKVVFGDERFNAVFVNSHVGPHEKSNEHADIAVSYVTEEREIKILCFVEAKHTQTRESYLTQSVEERALKYCREFLNGDASNQGQLVYAGTLVGTHLRLWFVYRAQQAKDIVLIPSWGSPQLGSNEDYADLGDTKGGPLIEKTFHEIILLPPEQWVDASMSGKSKETIL